VEGAKGVHWHHIATIGSCEKVGDPSELELKKILESQEGRILLFRAGTDQGYPYDENGGGNHKTSISRLGRIPGKKRKGVKSQITLQNGWELKGHSDLQHGFGYEWLYKGGGHSRFNVLAGTKSSWRGSSTISTEKSLEGWMGS